MKVSVVIPARNAAATLPETLLSVRGQTHAAWEAFVVDDASTDATRAVARGIAAEDGRIHVLDGPGAGAGPARNLGIDRAEGDVLLFLDADDLIAPVHLERFVEVLSSSEHGAAHCGWARLMADGTLIRPLPFGETGDLFRALAQACWFPIHGCVLRTDAVRAVGGFDADLLLCEDWDLWQRVARTGITFGHVPETLALYRMRPDSASFRTAQLLADGLRVLDWSHGEDPRVGAAAAQRPGAPTSELPRARLMLACWIAGLALGAGQDPLPLLDNLRADREPGLDPAAVAEVIYWAVPVGRCDRPAAWAELWGNAQHRVRTFLGELERLSGSTDLAARAARSLERRVVAHAAGTTGTASLGPFQARRIEATAPIEECVVPAGISRLVVEVLVEGAALGTIELPVCDGVVTSSVLADGIAGELAWPILGRYLARAVYPALRLADGPDGVAVWRDALRIAAGVDASDPDLFHDAVGWTVFLQELFAEPGLQGSNFYDPHSSVRGAATRGAAASVVVIDVADDPAHITGEREELDVVATVGGAPLGLVRIPLQDGVVSAAAVRAALTEATGFELARAVVREAILGRQLDDADLLRERLRQAAARVPPGRDGFAARSLGGAGDAFPRRLPRDIGGAASRHGALPSATVGDLLEAGVLGESETVAATNGRQGGGTRAAYVPGLLVLGASEALPARAERGTLSLASEPDRPYTRRYFESMFANRVDPWRYENAYEQRKYQQTLALVEKGSANRVLELGCAEGHFTAQLALHVGTLVAADISEIAVERARERCRDLTNVEFRPLDIVRDTLPAGFDLIVCSEVLYYVGDRAELVRVARKLADALVPGGRLVTAHAHVLADDPDRTGFDWELEFGARVIGETLVGAGGLALVHELRTPLYRIQLLERPRGNEPPADPTIEEASHGSPLPADVAAFVRWDGGRPGQSDPVEPVTRELPILMYHRVTADPGAAETARYRVAPAAFDDQLRYLSQSGYRGVSLRDWARAMRTRQPLPGRCVAITFDDAYRDFLTDAWPLLRRHGFGASLFVVADEIGGWNRWDEATGERLGLLDRDELRSLVADGVEIGSHTATHRRLTQLSAEDVAREAIRSRTAIERSLGTTADVLAYPYGDLDGAVRRLVGACGYEIALAASGGRCRLSHDVLELPRLEVTGTDTLEDFVRVVEGNDLRR